jgi:AmiR/NasT family two-component response regulator
METRVEIDRDMIAELQRDGVLSREPERQLEEALKSSRTIGAAVGIIMGTRRVSEEVAFDVLKAASSNSNRKLREIAAELVASADR